MPERIVVGISGGVDSALAATLLQERGFDVIGCYLKVNLTTHDSRLTPCPWREDLPMAHRVAAYLNIPLIVKDVSTEYERDVLEPMVAAYRAGETPNPDITCNRWVKFDALIAVAREVGAARIATGHYARIKKDFSPSLGEGELEGVGDIELHRGLDHAKDQSYFLATLTQEQLARCEFPLGEWRKENVRAEAKRRDLPNWDRHSTSGVCFLGHLNLVEFMAERRNQNTSPFLPLPRGGGARGGGVPGVVRGAATVVTTTGKVLGTVPTPEALTIGQRVPIAGQPAPRYVVARETKNSPTLSVGESQRVIVSASPDDPARYTSVVHAMNPHWIGRPPKVSPPPTGRGSERGWGTLRCSARIRHRQEPQPCTVSNVKCQMSSVRVVFPTPLTGVAPGQTIVFSNGDRILGSATIAGCLYVRSK